MENASKALVIAGAILISILIIGLGVFIYNGAASTVSTANLNSQEAQAQNQQFEAYFGSQKSAAEVKQLCSLIRSNNITGDTGEESKTIIIRYKDAGHVTDIDVKQPNEVSSYVVNGKTYNVGVANDNSSDEDPRGNTAGTDKTSAYYNSGFIRVINVVENSTPGKISNIDGS